MEFVARLSKKVSMQVKQKTKLNRKDNTKD
jgi:hypothetical protein